MAERKAIAWMVFPRLRKKDASSREHPSLPLRVPLLLMSGELEVIVLTPYRPPGYHLSLASTYRRGRELHPSGSLEDGR